MYFMPAAPRSSGSHILQFILNQLVELTRYELKYPKGTYALPGGRLEAGESFEVCAARELREETGLEISADVVRFLTAVSSVFEGVHWVTIFMGARIVGEAEPKVLEPDKCEEWRWMTWDQVYQSADEAVELFQPLRDLVRQRASFQADTALEQALKKA